MARIRRFLGIVILGMSIDGTPGFAEPMSILGVKRSVNRALGRDVPDTSKPALHWNFQASGGAKTWSAKHYSPNLDGVGFQNVNPGYCYGHSVLSIRWFMNIVRPLKNRKIERITPQEFRDLWGGEFDYPPAYDLTAANIDRERLALYSMSDEHGRLAVAELIGYFQYLEFNLLSHSRKEYSSNSDFKRDLLGSIKGGEPVVLSLQATMGKHAVVAYKIEEGTAMYGNTGGAAGVRKKAYKVCFWDSNDRATGNAGDDAGTEANFYFIAFEDGSDFMGASETFEGMFPKQLRETDIPGTWKLRNPVAMVDIQDGNDMHGWHFAGVWDSTKRKIAGLPSADAAKETK